MFAQVCTETVVTKQLETVSANEKLDSSHVHDYHENAAHKRETGVKTSTPFQSSDVTRTRAQVLYENTHTHTHRFHKLLVQCELQNKSIEKF